MKKYRYSRAASQEEIPVLQRLDRHHTLLNAAVDPANPEWHEMSFKIRRHIESTSSESRSASADSISSSVEDIGFDEGSTASTLVITDNDLASSWLYASKRGMYKGSDNQAFETSSSDPVMIRAAVMPSSLPPPPPPMPPIRQPLFPPFPPMPKESNQDEYEDFPKLDLKPVPIAGRQRSKLICCCYTTVMLIIFVCFFGLLSSIGGILYLELFAPQRTLNKVFEGKHNENILVEHTSQVSTIDGRNVFIEIAHPVETQNKNTMSEGKQFSSRTGDVYENSRELSPEDSINTEQHRTAQPETSFSFLLSKDFDESYNSKSEHKNQNNEGRTITSLENISVNDFQNNIEKYPASKNANDAMSFKSSSDVKCSSGNENSTIDGILCQSSEYQNSEQEQAEISDLFKPYEKQKKSKATSLRDESVLGTSSKDELILDSFEPDESFIDEDNQKVVVKAHEYKLPQVFETIPAVQSTRTDASELPNAYRKIKESSQLSSLQTTYGRFTPFEKSHENHPTFASDTQLHKSLPLSEFVSNGKLTTQINEFGVISKPTRISTPSENIRLSFHTTPNLQSEKSSNKYRNQPKQLSGIRNIPRFILHSPVEIAGIPAFVNEEFQLTTTTNAPVNTYRKMIDVVKHTVHRNLPSVAEQSSSTLSIENDDDPFSMVDGSDYQTRMVLQESIANVLKRFQSLESVNIPGFRASDSSKNRFHGKKPTFDDVEKQEYLERLRSLMYS